MGKLGEGMCMRTERAHPGRSRVAEGFVRTLTRTGPAGWAAGHQVDNVVKRVGAGVP